VLVLPALLGSPHIAHDITQGKKQQGHICMDTVVDGVSAADARLAV
jgi:hypothetical protein